MSCEHVHGQSLWKAIRGDKIKPLIFLRIRGFGISSPETTYFRKKYNSLSSAWRRFTVLFGMGRSGSTLLWPPGFNWSAPFQEPIRFDLLHPVISPLGRFTLYSFSSALTLTTLSPKQHGYRIKPHEQLVSVSSTPYSAYTPDLSTSWSRTTLQGGYTSGKTYLQESFPLRCFQRLSRPHLATRQCHWRDNRYTRGASTPVLSY